MPPKLLCPLSVLLPLCHSGAGTIGLEKIGSNPIFDRNVIGLVAQFAVWSSFTLSRDSAKSYALARFTRILHSRDRGALHFFVFNRSYLFWQQNPAPRFLLKWGVDPVKFRFPGAVAVLARSQDRGLARSQDLCHPHTDLVFVADSGNDRIQSFRGDGTPVNTWGSRGSANGQLQFPCGVAVLARSQDRGHPTQDLVYVADCHNHRIQVFNFDGSFVRKWGSFGQGDGQFHYPCEVAVLARSQDRCHPTRDCVFVADTGNQRMQVFDTDGTFIRKWGAPGSGDGQFLNISGVAVHPSQDLVFISDYQGHRIQAFRGNGVFLFKWGSHGSADGQLRLPKHLALHPTRDLLFIADSGNHRVQVFDLHGSFVCKWGSEDELSSPLGVAVHPQQDVVYVTSAQFVQAFTLFTRNKNSKKSTVRTQC